MIPRLSNRRPATVPRRKSARPQAISKARGLVTKAQVKQMIHSIVDQNMENKYFDTVNNSAANIDWDGSVPFALTNIPQGVTDLNRTGDTLIVKKLSWSALIKYAQVNTTTNLAMSVSVLRLLIFVWKPFFTDVAPTVAKVLTYTGTYYACHGPITHDGIDQITVLYDSVHVLDGISQANKLVRGSVVLNHTVQYKNASTTNSAGGIYALFISDAVSGAGPYPVVADSVFRVDFTDA